MRSRVAVCTPCRPCLEPSLRYGSQRPGSGTNGGRVRLFSCSPLRNLLRTRCRGFAPGTVRAAGRGIGGRAHPGQRLAHEMRISPVCNLTRDAVGWALARAAPATQANVGRRLLRRLSENASRGMERATVLGTAPLCWGRRQRDGPPRCMDFDPHPVLRQPPQEASAYVCLGRRRGTRQGPAHSIPRELQDGADGHLVGFQAPPSASQRPEGATGEPVSYTHLTLPTSDLV